MYIGAPICLPLTRRISSNTYRNPSSWRPSLVSPKAFLFSSLQQTSNSLQSAIFVRIIAVPRQRAIPIPPPAGEKVANLHLHRIKPRLAASPRIISISRDKNSQIPPNLDPRPPDNRQQCLPRENWLPRLTLSQPACPRRCLPLSKKPTDGSVSS